VAYRITLAPPAARQLRKFDPQVRRRIQAALELLAGEPRPPASTSGRRRREWRIRTGDYRIIYEIRDDELLVLVLRVGHPPRQPYVAVDRPGRAASVASLQSGVRHQSAANGR
jgi:mRNA interferase RelE/StbE